MGQRMRVRGGPVLRASGMGAMNFLNEAATRFPEAVSFAAGRPPDLHADPRPSERWIERFVAHRAATLHRDADAVWRELGQYGNTDGMITDLVAEWLRRDEAISVDPRAVMITNGFQEALLVGLLGLFDRERDVVLAEDPSYVGLAGAAAIAGIPIEPLDSARPLLDALPAAVEAARRRGRVPRALYVVPDHSNPTGRTLTLAEREGLLRMAEREGMLILEDTAYRAFWYETERLPSLKALDRTGQVILLGSFSKVFLPGVRLGYLIADQPIDGDAAAAGACVAEELSQVKSFVSVLSSPIAQAIVGGFLLEHEYRLETFCRDKVSACARRRDHLLACLESVFGEDASLRGLVRWSRPSGGFFLIVTLPFDFGREEMMVCAGEYGVIVTPLTFFSLRGGFQNQVRLSFSNVPMERIRPGVEGLHRFVRAALSSAPRDARPEVARAPVVRRVSVDELEALMTSALARRAVPPEHRALVVDGLISTSLRGVDSHGIRLFPAYLRELDGGRAAARPAIEIVRTSPGTARIDAGGALGLVAGGIAAREAVALAQVAGVGAVAVRGSNHYGAGAVHAIAMARAGCVGLCFSNTDALVVPHGGRSRLLGTNPISVAAVADGDDLFSVDLATSRGTFLRHLRPAEPVPPGILADAAGHDCASSHAPPAALFPLGGHKGQCLGMVVEIVCALLAGGPFDHELTNMFTASFDRPRDITHFFLAIHIPSFQDPAAFRARLRQLLEHTRAQPAASPGGRVLVPGDLEAEAAVDRRAHGIPVDDDTWGALLASGDDPREP